MLGYALHRPSHVMQRSHRLVVHAASQHKGSRRIFRKSTSKYRKKASNSQSQPHSTTQPATGPTIADLLQQELSLPQFYAEQFLVCHPTGADLAYTSAKADVYVLTSLFTKKTAREVLLRCPTLLGSQLILWRDFFSSYGLSTEQLRELLLESPEVLVQSSLYDAGRAILLLREFGFSNQEIVNEFIKPVPHFLCMDLEKVVTDKAPLLPAVVGTRSSEGGEYNLKECIYIWVHHQSVLSKVKTKQQAAAATCRWL